jgi:hypothetical protein
VRTWVGLWLWMGGGLLNWLVRGGRVEWEMQLSSCGPHTVPCHDRHAHTYTLSLTAFSIYKTQDSGPHAASGDLLPVCDLQEQGADGGGAAVRVALLGEHGVNRVGWGLSGLFA